MIKLRLQQQTVLCTIMIAFFDIDSCDNVSDKNGTPGPYRSQTCCTYCTVLLQYIGPYSLERVEITPKVFIN